MGFVDGLQIHPTFKPRPTFHPHLETQITATDSQIDQLAYALYDLSDGEIALVEASAKSS